MLIFQTECKNMLIALYNMQIFPPQKRNENIFVVLSTYLKVLIMNNGVSQFLLSDLSCMLVLCCALF